MSPLFVIFFTVFIDMVGFGIVIPVLPLYAEHFHATPLEIGWLTGIYSGMQILFTPLLGRLSDRVGRRPVLIVSLAGTALGFLVMGWASSLPLLFSRASSMAPRAATSPPRRLTSPMSAHRKIARVRWALIGAAFGLGFTFGPMIGGILSRISYGAPFYFAAALAALNVVLLYFILPESLSKEYRSRPHERTKLAEVFRHGHGKLFGTIVVTYFFNITGFAIMTTLFALLTEKHFGYDARQTGYIFGFIGIISVILQGGLIGRLVKMFGETALARTGLFLLALAMLFLPLVSTLSMLLLVCGVTAVANGLVNPTLNGLASQMIDRSWQGRALGLMQSAGSVGRLVGPLLGGWLLMFDLRFPIARYARTPLFASAGLLFVAFLLALSFRRPASRYNTTPSPPCKRMFSGAKERVAPLAES